MRFISRLLKELKDIQGDGVSGSGSTSSAGKRPNEIDVLEPIDDDDLSLWTAVIKGPPDSPYEGGKFRLRLEIPSGYPMQPPRVTFVTRVCHPNVHFKVLSYLHIRIVNIGLS